MKQKVSDYIADYIANWGIRDVFTVTGGGAMHMNDAFWHHPKLQRMLSTSVRGKGNSSLSEATPAERLTPS